MPSTKHCLDLKERYGIEVPIEKSLRKVAEQKLMETILLEQIKKGNNTTDSIAKELKMARGHISRELGQLANKGLISINKTERPYRFILK